MLINLTQNKKTIIDDEDISLVSGQNWHAVFCNKKDFYAARTVNRKRIWLHRVITSCPTGFFVDHINGNTLDNRRCNLRICTKTQNSQNQHTSLNKYKGVHWHKRVKKYCASIRVNQRLLHLGYSDSEKDCAALYNAAAIKFFGEFARVNIII